MKNKIYEKFEINRTEKSKTYSTSIASSNKLLSKKYHIFYLLILVFVFLSAEAFLYYKNAVKELKKEKQSDMEFITRYKIKQITKWKADRLADVRVFSNSSLFSHGIKEWVNNKESGQINSDILNHLKEIKVNYNYQDIFLVNKDGTLLLSLDSTFQKVDSSTLHFIINYSDNKKISNTDLYYCPLHKTIHYDFISPIEEDGKPIAFMVFRINPYWYLYPSIKSWPTQTKTS